MTEQFANNAITTLNGTITSGALSLVVTSATAFPTAGNFRILIDSEIMLVTSVSGTTFTITRAQESTTAATHSNGATVTQIVTAGALSQVKLDVGALTGLAANRPTATGSGRLYFCDDVPVVYVDDQTTVAWKQYGVMGYLPAPGSIAGWTVVGNGLSLVQKGDSILGLCTAAQNSAALKPIPVGFLNQPWAVDLFGFLMQQMGSQYPEFGVCVSNGTTSGTSTMYVMSRYASSNGWFAGADTVGSVQAGKVVYNSSDGNTDMYAGSFGVNVRIVSDNTELYFQVSGDGEFWRTWGATALPAGLTNYGFTIFTDTSTGLSGALVEKIRIQSPTSVNVSNVVTNGTIATITTASAHNLTPGEQITIRGLTGTGTAPNGIWGVSGGGTASSGLFTVTAANTFTVPFVSSFTYTSGGVVTNLSQ